jgi:hypothetical protein
MNIGSVLPPVCVVWTIDTYCVKVSGVVYYVRIIVLVRISVLCTYCSFFLGPLVIVVFYVT